MEGCKDGKCGSASYQKMKETIQAREVVVDQIFERLRKALEGTDAMPSRGNALYISVDLSDGSFMHMRDVDWKSKSERKKFAKFLRKYSVDVEALVEGIDVP